MKSISLIELSWKVKMLIMKHFHLGGNLFKIELFKIVQSIEHKFILQTKLVFKNKLGIKIVKITFHLEITQTLTVILKGETFQLLLKKQMLLSILDNLNLSKNLDQLTQIMFVIL